MQLHHIFPGLDPQLPKKKKKDYVENKAITNYLSWLSISFSDLSWVQTTSLLSLDNNHNVGIIITKLIRLVNHLYKYSSFFIFIIIFMILLTISLKVFKT